MPIVLEELSHVYMEGSPFESVALDKVSLTIEDGEFVGLIGHTGSGKSTLVQHLNGLLKPTSGKITVDGLDLSDKETDMREVRRRVGLVFQYPEYQLFEETVRKDIAFGPGNLGINGEDLEARVRLAAAQVGLEEELLDKSPFELSGGQKRRVAIAGVLAMQPKVLVLDEPTAGLDPKGREELIDLMRSLNASGVTLVMVSHSMNDVARLCSRVLVMNHGRLALSGSAGEVFSHGKELKEMGLGLPDGARLAALLRAQGWAIPDTVYKFDQIEPLIEQRLLKGGRQEC
ncbi:MAG TPA: energy-coupling factor transporter ATPase [Candidatus Faecaligallichristensenella faecipullorum]|nr:energy-coupling factor transporter ATPase [Candidatus Faecaligallichristensenella faecipullorum]